MLQLSCVVSLLKRRGELLEKAWKKLLTMVKKGRSQSKLYGSSDQPTPKHPKYDQQMREDRIKSIEDQLGDVARILFLLREEIGSG